MCFVKPTAFLALILLSAGCTSLESIENYLAPRPTNSLVLTVTNTVTNVINRTVTNSLTNSTTNSVFLSFTNTANGQFSNIVTDSLAQTLTNTNNLVFTVTNTTVVDLEITNTVIALGANFVTNASGVYTNVRFVTNVVTVWDTFTVTNVAAVTDVLWVSTNVHQSVTYYDPIPSEFTVYVDGGSSHSTWTGATLHWWYQDGSGSGDAVKLSNYNDGSITWWVFQLTGMDMHRKTGIKVNDGGVNWEPIKTENGARYGRIITPVLLTKSNSTTVTYAVSNSVITSVTNRIGTWDRFFVYSPNQWYEGFPYLYEYETNLYRSPADDGMTGEDPWNWYMGANWWGNGVTVFSFYFPHVRRAYVGGEWNNWQKVPMKMSKDKVWWWAVVSNTQPGQAYKFCLEKFADDYGGPYEQWISDPGAKKNNNTPPGDSYIVDQGAYLWGDTTWSRPGFDYYSIYQMHVRTFETNGPGTFYGWGTFASATNKFDYLADLGFTAIEPLPVQEFAGDQSWGYNYTMFYSPESAYCGENARNADTLKAFVDQAHQRGLAVIFDLVFNHMGASDDPIGTYDPAADWQNPQTYWYSGKTDWGPKFNFANPVVTKFLKDSAVYFGNVYHADGFRFDATEYIFFGDTASPGGAFLYDLTRNIRSRVSGNVLLIAENLPNRGWITEATGAAFNYQWNADMAHNLKKLFNNGTSGFDIGTMAGLVTGNSYGGWAGLNYMVSHDEAANGKQRTAADLHYVRGWGTDEYDAQCQQITGLATVLMGQGIPMMLQGDEFLEGFYDDFYLGEPYNARWFTDSKALSWNNFYYNATNIPARLGAARTRGAIKELAWLRRNNPAVKFSGINVTMSDNANKILAFQRGGNIFVVINYDKKNWGSYNPAIPTGNWSLIYAHPSSAYGIPFADGYLSGNANSGDNIKIPEYGVLVYKKN